MTLTVAGLRYKMCENHEPKRGMTTVRGLFSVTVVWASQNFPCSRYRDPLSTQNLPMKGSDAPLLRIMLP